MKKGEKMRKISKYSKKSHNVLGSTEEVIILLIALYRLVLVILSRKKMHQNWYISNATVCVFLMLHFSIPLPFYVCFIFNKLHGDRKLLRTNLNTPISFFIRPEANFV